MDGIRYEVENMIGLITLDRTERKNAFTVEMIHAWAAAVDEAASDDQVRVLVVTGAGDSFCAGADIKQMGEDADDEKRRAESRTPITSRRYLTDNVHRVALALDRMQKPSIAAVNGPAIGAGMDMALMCDMRIAGRSARFAEAYIRAGLIPGNGGCYFLPRIVGLPKALELLLTGDFVDAEEAHKIGLVNRLVDDGDLMEETMKLATKLANSPPIQVQLTRRTVYESLDMDLRTSLSTVASHMAVVRTLDDSIEALNAFRERRPGNYKGA
ncbi:MAG: enoyl-CoA hydratase-related protein [Acidimicrobiales bacterium]